MAPSSNPTKTPVLPPGATLPSLETLIIHHREPGFRYHCELLSALTLPALKRLEIPWHDDLTVEDPDLNRAPQYLLHEDGTPRFGTVTELYLHDSTLETTMPTRTFMEAFPNVEEIVLGGVDVANFVATLQGFVLSGPALPAGTGRRGSRDRKSQGVLMDGAWQTVRKIVLKEPEPARWKGWVKGLYVWLAAEGNVGKVCVEIQNDAPRDGNFDECETRVFWRSIDRLRRHASEVLVVLNNEGVKGDPIRQSRF